jgi:hypothetical protein
MAGTRPYGGGEIAPAGRKTARAAKFNGAGRLMAGTVSHAMTRAGSVSLTTPHRRWRVFGLAKAMTAI